MGAGVDDTRFGILSVYFPGVRLCRKEVLSYNSRYPVSHGPVAQLARALQWH